MYKTEKQPDRTDVPSSARLFPAHSVFPPFGQDIPRMIESWRILAGTGCKLFLPGHGGWRSLDQLTRQYQKYTGRRR